MKSSSRLSAFSVLLGGLFALAMVFMVGCSGDDKPSDTQQQQQQQNPANEMKVAI